VAVAQVGETLLKTKKKMAPSKDRRRKHSHWQVVIYYPDGEKFARVYTDHKKATSFTKRQKKSPVVKSVRVVQVG
jgi:hypothetical protein